jgi:tetratricopeptide (TPR) repeat protein
MIILFLFFLAPCQSYASEDRESIYTIQIVSHFDSEAANRQYTDIIEKFDKRELPYLRIEKIGKYYALRLGKYSNKSEAKELHRSVKSRLPSSFIIKAYFIEERIEQIHLPETALKEAIHESETEEPAEEDSTAPVIGDVPIEEIIAEISGLVHKKDYASALEIVRKEIKAQPEQPELNAWYGTVLLKTDRPDMALQYMRKAVELSPSTADYHNGLGYCFYYLEQHDKAIDSFNNALSLDTEHIDALAGLGLAYTRNGNTGKAMDAYKKLRSLDRDSADKLLRIIKDAH